MKAHPWIEVRRGASPLLVSLPHTGVEMPAEIEARVVSPWLARKDTDWWVDRLYDFAHEELGATTVRTRISRTVLDVNRDPSGASLYPGQAITELCPTTTFDGELLYREGQAPDAREVLERRKLYFDSYHAALAEEIGRLRELHAAVVLYDAHSIRSRIPRLFQGELPDLNLGTNNGTSCEASLTDGVVAIARETKFRSVTDGRFRGGWITRTYGRPDAGVHAIQMELACRSYLVEPRTVSESNWPPAYDEVGARPLRSFLKAALQACVGFATERPQRFESESS